MFKKFFIFLFTVFLTVNCYSSNGIITVQERCQIAYKNLELLNNPNREIFIREEGKLRKLYYSEILAQRAENQEIIAKFCTQRVEEKTSDSEKYQTKQAGIGEPSTVTAFRTALVEGNVAEALTLLDVMIIDYSVEKEIRKALEKEDFTAALNIYNDINNNNKDGKNNTVTANFPTGNSGGNSGGGRNNSPQGAIETVLATSVLVKKSNSLRQYSKTGGFEAAKRDFYSMKPENVQTRSNGAITGRLADGRNINVRSFSKGTFKEEGLPTLEIQNSSSNVIKIRYTEK